jgi:hypothetical protein
MLEGSGKMKSLRTPGAAKEQVLRPGPCSCSRRSRRIYTTNEVFVDWYARPCVLCSIYRIWNVGMDYQFIK